LAWQEEDSKWADEGKDKKSMKRAAEEKKKLELARRKKVSKRYPPVLSIVR